jgi:hypothetical protein
MLQNILINLNILSKIKPYDKIYINKDNLITIETNTILQGLVRFIYNNGREKNINNLNTFYSDLFNLIDDILNSHYLHIANIIDIENDEFIRIYTNLTKINFYLKASLSGLNNLRKTYSNDIVSDSKLEIIINNIDIYLTKIKKKIDLIELNNITIEKNLLDINTFIKEKEKEI